MMKMAKRIDLRKLKQVVDSVESYAQHYSTLSQHDMNELLDMPIASLDLSEKLIVALESIDIITIRQLLQKRIPQLVRISGIGIKCICDIFVALKRIGIY